jgi:hypothetical protein
MSFSVAPAVLILRSIGCVTRKVIMKRDPAIRRLPSGEDDE